MNNQPKTIRIRKGLNGFRYSACDDKGNFIGNFHKLSEIRQYWKKEIQWNLIVLVRELDKYPDTKHMDETKRMIEAILKSYSKKKRKA